MCSSLDVPLTHTTSSEVIASHLNKTGGKHNKLLVFATYTSVKKIETAAREVQKPFSLVVLDEAHFTAGKGDDSGRALSEEYIRADRRLFLTATPRLLGRGKADGGNANAGGDNELVTMRSMDDEALFGPIVYSLKRSEAIQHGITVPVKLTVVEKRNGAHPETLELIAHAQENMNTDESASLEYAFKALIVQDFVERHNLKKIISFSRTNERSRLLHGALS